MLPLVKTSFPVYKTTYSNIFSVDIVAINRTTTSTTSTGIYSYVSFWGEGLPDLKKFLNFKLTFGIRRINRKFEK